jgi:hypothetical protein
MIFLLPLLMLAGGGTVGAEEAGSPFHVTMEELDQLVFGRDELVPAFEFRVPEAERSLGEVLPQECYSFHARMSDRGFPVEGLLYGFSRRWYSADGRLAVESGCAVGESSRTVQQMLEMQGGAAVPSSGSPSGWQLGDDCWFLTSPDRTSINFRYGRVSVSVSGEVTRSAMQRASAEGDDASPTFDPLIVENLAADLEYRVALHADISGVNADRPATRSAKLFVGEREVPCDPPPVFLKDLVMVPLIPLLPAFDAELVWYPDQRKGELLKGKTVERVRLFELTNGRPFHLPANAGEQVPLAWPRPVVCYGRQPIVPAPALAELVGWKVAIDANAGTVRFLPPPTETPGEAGK